MIGILLFMCTIMFITAVVGVGWTMVRITGALKSAQKDANSAMRIVGRAEQAFVDLATSPLLDTNARTLASAALNELRGELKNEEITE